MNETLDGRQVVEMLEQVAQHVIDNTERLTDADLAIGDGDHGIGMRRGFESVLQRLQDLAAPTPESAMKSAGMAIMSSTGGAAGAIFGTVFRSGSKALASKESFDATAFAAFLQAGLQAAEQRGGSTTGQKTMIDALSPAARAAAGGSDESLENAMAAAAAAATLGAERTRDMIATTGKARSLGERSLGHVDPGAISICLILDAMYAFVTHTDPMNRRDNG